MKDTSALHQHTSAGTSIDEFKLAFRQHPAGVTLVAAHTSDGLAGLTLSSLASVGIDPLSVVFSVTRPRGSAGALLRAESFVVHLLADRHAGLARDFAVSGSPRFTPEQGWSTLPTGEPHLPDARWALRARPLQTIPVGESSLVIAEVLDVLPGVPGDPLIYHDRTFRGLDAGVL